MAKQITIIGGGVIGLCTAYYLQKEGYDILIIDKGDISDGASFGNAGFISPSHFTPLATPAIVGKAVKWMLDASSPFYIKPRLNADLLRWSMAFWKSANAATMQRHIVPLHEILQLSRSLMDEIKDELGNVFRMEEKGCLMLYKQASTAAHEYELSKQAAALGLNTEILSARELRNLDPMISSEVIGGVLYTLDCHLHPGDFMQAMKKYLVMRGVQFHLQTSVTGFKSRDGEIEVVQTDKGDVACDELVIAAGAWLPEVAHKLGLRILLQAGKGYSMTYPEVKNNLRYPSILMERRVAMSPMGRDLRMGGTMEISGLNSPVLPKRVAAIFNAAKEYYPDLDLRVPDSGQIWQGLRPLSPDGLPYIGRHHAFENLYICGGHSMMGLSLSAATGQLTEELISGKKTSMDIRAFSPERFG